MASSSMDQQQQQQQPAGEQQLPPDTSASSSSFPPLGAVRCYWAIMDASMNFRYLDPILQFHLQEVSATLSPDRSSRLLRRTSLRAFIPFAMANDVDAHLSQRVALAVSRERYPRCLVYGGSAVS